MFGSLSRILSTILTTLKNKIENAVVPRAHPIRHGSYILLWKIAYDWSALVLASPVRLQFNEEAQAFEVKKCNRVQRCLSLLAQILYGISSAHSQYLVGCTLLRNKGHIVAYFDFFNYIFVNYGYYVHVYVHWYRPDILEAFVKELQTNPCIKYCRTSVLKVVLIATAVCAAVSYLAFMWPILCFGIDYWSIDGFRSSLESAAKEIFLWDGNARVQPVLPLCILAYAARLFNALYIHVSLNIFTPLQLFALYFILSDFLDCIVGNGIEPEKVLRDLDAYRRLMRATNKFLSLYLLHYISVVLTYHSVHLFDLLHGASIWWKISTCFYVGYIVNYFLMISLISIKTKKIKKWTWQNKNYLLIPKRNLTIILNDVLGSRFGIWICGMYSMTAGSSATILTKVISYALLVKLYERI